MAKSVATSPSRLEALLAIGKLVAPKSKALASEVTLAFADPGAYAKRFAQRMEARSIGRPPKKLAWIALVDALAEADALVELDHRDETTDVTLALDRLLRPDDSRARWAWLKAFSTEELEDMELAELLEQCGAHLGEEGLVLAQLDLSSDAFPLVVVPAKQAKRLVELGEAAGYGDVDLFTGSDLAAMQQERRKREALDRPVTAQSAITRRYFLCKTGGVTWVWSVLPIGSDVELRTGVLGGELEKSTFQLNAPSTAVFESERLAAVRSTMGYDEISLEDYLARDAEEAERLAKSKPATRKKKTKTATTKSRPKSKTAKP